MFIHFSKKEGEIPNSAQRALYKVVMVENYGNLVCIGEIFTAETFSILYPSQIPFYIVHMGALLKKSWNP